MKESKRESQNGSTLRKAREWARDVGQDGLVPSIETAVDQSCTRGSGEWAEKGDRGGWEMSRQQEHNMWSEESRGQQRGARGQQFEPDWTVTQAEREGEERMMSRAVPQRWVGRSGGFRKIGNETARSPAQLAKKVYRPVVNDRAGKKGTKCWSPLQEEAECLSGAARRDGLRLRVCARTASMRRTE